MSFLKKCEVLHNLKRLKGTNVFIVHDLCKEDREEQKILRAHLKSARSKNLLASIKGSTLFVNGEAYTIDQLKCMNLEQEFFRTVASKSYSAPSTPEPTHEATNFTTNGTLKASAICHEIPRLNK